MTRRDCGLMALAALFMPPGFAPHGAAAQEPERPALPASFDVVDSERGGRFVARVRVDEAGQVAIERADPDRQRWFANIVAELNKQQSILLPAPPPSSAPRFAMYGFPINRDDPRFLAAMRLYLGRYYALALQ